MLEIPNWEVERLQVSWNDWFSLLITRPAGVQDVVHGGTHRGFTIIAHRPQAHPPTTTNYCHPQPLLSMPLRSFFPFFSCWPVPTLESCYGFAPPNTCTGSDKNPYLLIPMSPLCIPTEQEGPAAGAEGETTPQSGGRIDFLQPYYPVTLEWVWKNKEVGGCFNRTGR